jgi:PhnB protein
MAQTATTTLQPIPYLGFGGDCEEAMRFYERALGGKITVLVRSKDTPMRDQVPAEFAEKIMNAQLQLPGGGLLYAGDTPPHIPFEGIKGVSITLNYSTAEEGAAAFGALSDGGTVTMPYGPTFWAKAFGMCVDKFGVPWLINGELTIM